MEELKEGFEVTESLSLGSLEDVKEEKVLIPPSRDALLRIKKATNTLNADATYRQVSVQFVVEDGILIGNETKYKGSTVFGKYCYYADAEKYTKDYFKKRQHLVQFKNLINAIGEDVANVEVNDELWSKMSNTLVVGTIRQVANKYTAKDGTLIDEMKNEVSNIKVVPSESQV